MKRAAFPFVFASLALQGASTNLPPFTREVLPNGAVVCLMPRKDVPMVTLRVVIRGGSESDPDGKAGLAALTGEMLTRGTKNRSSEDFARALEFHGASLNANLTRQAGAMALDVLSSSAGPVLDLVLEALLQPAFRDDEFRKLQAQRRDQAHQMKDIPQAVLPNYFNAFLFGPSHPYGRPATGDETSLAGLRPEDVRAFYDAMYAGPNVIFIAVGDFDPAALKAKLSTGLAGLKKGTAYAWKSAARPGPASAPRLLLVDKPDATQTYFEIGQPGIRRTHPDRVPITIVNTLFGGRFTSLLNEALRVDAGLTYGANSRFDLDRLDGAFRISTFTKTASTLQAIDLALSILKKLRGEGIAAEQLASAKAYIKGEYPTRTMETAMQLSVILSDMEILGLARADYDDLFARIDAVTLEQANATARKYFGSENLSFVLLGNTSAIRDGVKKYAPQLVEVKAVTPGYPVR